ncbi:hypothetical protein MPTK1_3g07070 [Marchantia polymorpha subsp. ruderalis]|uniref:Uncharacterized protein n=2 Tax=Marchantia polymorpha TaxID=3197 RepID=A0AAF6AY77_MARPO|nr:hypothetical protein MARPO_0006s0180 [Marchantia polymorpha]BBN04711.1 hypothetical protein Mp_3g07070 [Marchantia polymorpha subsp. ruderalis]|eukprot:PTQ48155.1 hypothetical protein MARPO_0006s0180 [Marchantia polymorpha]
MMHEHRACYSIAADIEPGTATRRKRVEEGKRDGKKSKKKLRRRRRSRTRTRSPGRCPGGDDGRSRVGRSVRAPEFKSEKAVVRGDGIRGKLPVDVAGQRTWRGIDGAHLRDEVGFEVDGGAHASLTGLDLHGTVALAALPRVLLSRDSRSQGSRTEPPPSEQLSSLRGPPSPSSSCPPSRQSASERQRPESSESRDCWCPLASVSLCSKEKARGGRRRRRTAKGREGKGRKTKRAKRGGESRRGEIRAAPARTIACVVDEAIPFPSEKSEGGRESEVGGTRGGMLEMREEGAWRADHARR